MIKIRFRSADVMAIKALDEQKARQYLMDLQRDAPLVFPWDDALKVVRSIQAGHYVTISGGAMDVTLKMVSCYRDRAET